MQTTEIERIFTDAGYVFRIYYTKHTYDSKEIYVGTVIGILHHFRDSDYAKFGCPHNFICENLDEVLAEAQVYITLGLDMQMLGRLPVQDEYLFK